MIANIQMGSRPKSDGTDLGKTVLEQQETLKQAILSYFSTAGTAGQIADWFVRSMLCSKSSSA